MLSPILSPLKSLHATPFKICIFAYDVASAAWKSCYYLLLISMRLFTIIYCSLQMGSIRWLSYITAHCHWTWLSYSSPPCWSQTVLFCDRSGNAAKYHSNSSAYKGEWKVFICCNSFDLYQCSDLNWLTKSQLNIDLVQISEHERGWGIGLSFKTATSCWLTTARLTEPPFKTKPCALSLLNA